MLKVLLPVDGSESATRAGIGLPATIVIAVRRRSPDDEDDRTVGVEAKSIGRD